MNIYVGNISYSATEDQLREAFASYGEVSSIAIIIDKYTGNSRGFAFVEFADESTAMKAIEMFDGYELQGRTLRVNPAERQQQRSQGFGGFGSSGGGYRGPRASKPKGSRRNIRAQKRGY